MLKILAPALLLALAAASQAVVTIAIDNPDVTLATGQSVYTLYGTIDATTSTFPVNDLAPRTISATDPGSVVGGSHASSWSTVPAGHTYSGALFNVDITPSTFGGSGTITFVLDGGYLTPTTYTVLGTSGALSVTYSDVTPEPSALLALGVPALAFGLRKRRR